MKLSVVTTLYNSAPYLEEFYKRLTESIRKITNEYEIIFVNDGSPDDSLKIAIGFHEKNARVKILDLSRNFGHHNAVMTGLMHAQGEYTFLIDCDLEEDPEILETFWNELENDEDLAVIYGVQKKRKGGWFEKWSGNWFYRLFNALSDTNIKPNLATVRLMRRNYLAALGQYGERNLFMAGICEHAGYRQKPFYITKSNAEKSSYNIRRKISLFVNAIASFSSKPLVLSFYAGVMTSLASFLYACYLIAVKLLYGIPVPGYTSLIVSIWFLSGLVLVSIGLLGIYISKIYDEVKQRPRTIISKEYSRIEE